MSEWKEYKLGEVAIPVRDRIETSCLDISSYISTENMLPNKAGVTLSSGIPEGNAIKFKEEDILISNIRPYFKKIWKADKIGGCSGDVICLRASEGVDSLYLYYLLSQDKFFNYVMLGSKGTKMPRGDKNQIMQWPVLIPSKNQQNTIATILSSLDDKIAVNKRICENLEAQAQALFKHWFVDFAPFKDGNFCANREQNETCFNSAEVQPKITGKACKFVESELGLIPEGWKISTIYEYIDVIYGAPYKSSLFNDKKNGLPLIRIRDLKTYSPQFYTPEILPTTEYIEAGNVVAGMDAEFIPYIWLGERGVLNQRCCKFKGKDNRISNYYILFLVKPELEYVQSYKTGTTVSHLGKSDIDRFRVVSPPLDVILSFSDIVNSMKEEVVTRAKESLRLSTLRDTLLPKLMSGQIKINEIEKSL